MGEIIELLNEICSNTNSKLRLVDSNNNEIYDNLPITESKIMKKIFIKD